eukprot:TRINITY_DN2094_c0_g4_i2.p1 TRINITY_DN2094_c0_g4~~TRINITY_DN2094_c0_g4_i2.p1  ORF type:complete len:330 (+),score=57.28 TRINITY_DN2094_c0_g4_i2:68-991(+)
MGLPAWALACVVVAVMMCLAGVFLCVHGCKMSKEKERKKREGEKGHGSELPQIPIPQNFQPPMAQQQQQQQHSPSPGQQQYSPGLAYRVDESQQSIPVQREGSYGVVQQQQFQDATTAAEQAEEQLRLEREITRLENEKWAMDNQWEGDVTVKLLNGTSHVVHVISTETVFTIKNKLTDIISVIPQNIRLVHGGRDLTPDTYMVGALKVPQNATLHLLVKNTSNQQVIASTATPVVPAVPLQKISSQQNPTPFAGAVAGDGECKVTPINSTENIDEWRKAASDFHGTAPALPAPPAASSAEPAPTLG